MRNPEQPLPVDSIHPNMFLLRIPLRVNCATHHLWAGSIQNCFCCEWPYGVPLTSCINPRGLQLQRWHHICWIKEMLAIAIREGLQLTLSPKLGTGPRFAIRGGLQLEGLQLEGCHCIPQYMMKNWRQFVWSKVFALFCYKQKTIFWLLIKI